MKFIEKTPKYSANFSDLSDENKDWILEYLSGGKGVIPYEKIKSHEDLNCVPEGECFKKSEFYSSLKNETISDEDYENVKKFWQLLRLTELTDLNDIYTFQDTIILCEIFENRAMEMMKKFLYSPGKCSSASLLSGCIHRLLSKAIIALPTQAEIVDLFERTLIGGFSCVNTRLAFDSKILLPKEDQKLIYKIKNTQENIFEDKRVVMKILKMDENNQHGNAMTKPLPIGSIKNSKKAPSLRNFDPVVQSISDEDRIGRLFIVDIEFDWKNARQKQLFFNEKFPYLKRKRFYQPAKDQFFNFWTRRD